MVPIFVLACGMNVFSSEYVAARPELLRQRDAFRQHVLLQGNSTPSLSMVRAEFYGDSTLRNVFCALCNSLTTLDSYVGNYGENGTWCFGWLGPFKLEAMYFYRTFSLHPTPHHHRPHVHNGSQTSSATNPLFSHFSSSPTTVIFFGMALWLAWPSPFHSPETWKGYDSWRTYESHVSSFVYAMRTRHPNAHIVAVSGHSVCGPGCLATYPHPLPNPPQLPCIHYVLRNHHSIHHDVHRAIGGGNSSGKNSNIHVDRSPLWSQAERMCMEATCGDGEVVLLNARLQKATRKLEWIDTYRLTHNQCWANDGDVTHYPFLVYEELALYVPHIWRQT